MWLFAGLGDCTCALCLRSAAVTRFHSAMPRQDVLSGRGPSSYSSGPAYLAGQLFHCCLVAAPTIGILQGTKPSFQLQLVATPKCAKAVSKTVRGVLAPRSAEAAFRQTHAVCKQTQAQFRHYLQMFCCMSSPSHIPKPKGKFCPWFAVNGKRCCKGLLLFGATWNLISQQQWIWVSMEQAWHPVAAFRFAFTIYDATLLANGLRCMQNACHSQGSKQL